MFRSAIALGLLATVLVAACQPEGRIFQVTLTGSDAPLPVVMTDETTLVTGISEAAVESATTANDPAVRADQDDPDVLILTWLGGACDQDTAVWFGPQPGGYVLNLAIHEAFTTSCRALGVPRGLRIVTSRPIPVNSVTVAGGS
ncbi:MAG TPA: hypothetical protein VK194_07875 [Candidatus Deferrimicrobium sp.]|nr:hypothetical protein [Candidatus Deferrimicrobium sp.]